MKVIIFSASTTPLKNENLFSKLFGKVPEYRREKVEKLALEKDKRLSLGAGVLLEAALDRLGVSQNRDIYTSPSGKPYLKDHPDVFFNLSHSGEEVLCSVAEREIGCDVERISRPRFSIAKRYYSPEENEYITSFKNGVGAGLAFFRVWTLKESFLKATGVGFAVKPSLFSVAGPDGIALKQSISDEKWQIAHITSPEGYCSAVCISGARRITLPEPERISLEEVY